MSGRESETYRIARVDIDSLFQVFQNFLQVACPRGTQETGAAFRLKERQHGRMIISLGQATNPRQACISFYSTVL